MSFSVIRTKKISFTLSAILFVVSSALVLTLGLKLGIDFTGGSLMEISFGGERPSVEEMHATLDPLTIDGLTVQPTGDLGYLMRMRFINEDEHQEILTTLRSTFETEVPVTPVLIEDGELVIDQGNTESTGNRVTEQRIETIGPSISSQLKERSLYAGVAVVLAIVVFVAYAFRKVSKPVQSWKYGLAAIVALVHDVMITIGIFSLLGYYLGVEVNIPFVVALLTILGYSVNDSIVVFDRIRENLIKLGPDQFEEAVKSGVAQTLLRSLNTSVTTLLVLLALFLFADGTIKYFALALIIGVVSGTYSSIFLASPLLVVLYRFGSKRDT
jgi:preprotein translocase subunit SecF